MNYQDFGEGKRIDQKKLQELIDASEPRELREIDSFWKNLLSDQILVGIMCDDIKYTTNPKTDDTIAQGSVIVPVKNRLLQKRPSGLYLIEGAITAYRNVDYRSGTRTVGSLFLYDLQFATSQIALPTDKFIPLYMNVLESNGIMMPPGGF
jgi:hypothetical protein